MPRGRKRGVISDDEDTFINNSDYVENTSNDPGGRVEQSAMTTDTSPKARATDQSEELSSVHDPADESPDFEDALSENENVKAKSDMSPDSGNGSPHPLQPEAVSSESEPQLLETKIVDPFEKEDIHTAQAPLEPVEKLNFSQQQVSISSPSKRRERESQKYTDIKKNEPRLVINKLTLTNFKSYAGVQEIGPFNSSFSAVVGPNGSGKSNVIDSMLFVFGFRASKMRQGKLSELIHNSEAGQKIDYCQVDIHFIHVLDDPHVPNSSTKIPESDIVISRRAFRTNGSQYYINGKNSTYTEVTEYLRGQGIDLDHKRFLILQGEVESIAQMKAKAEKENDDGLLEYLEDIIGTSKFKRLIDENLAKMESLNQVCMEKENRFELVENDTNSMEEKKNEALKFLKTEKELTNKRSIKFQVSIFRNEKILRENEAVAANISNKLNEETQKNQELSKELDSRIAEKSEIKAALGTLNKEISSFSKKQKSINNQSVSLEERLKNINTKVKKMEKIKHTSETTLSSSKMKYETMKSSNEQYKSDLAELETVLEREKDQLNKLRTQLTAKTSEFSQEIQVLQEKLEPFRDKMKENEGNIELIDSEIKMLESQKVSLENKLREASKRLVEIKAEGKAKEAESEALERKLLHIEEQITLGEEQVNSSKKNLEGKRVRLASARSKTQDAINSIANAENKNKVLASLTRLAKSGRISGFHGRLGDLGEIEDKYDIAISTACPALDSMVVDTVETAQACIDYLRKNKLGYANFVCLNKLRNFNMSPIQTPGSPMTVRRIFDLINPRDKKFLPAFYSKLRDTLVASNLQEAKSVAFGPKRFKVVTLDGKVVDTSGTMSGGGNSSAKGAMKLKSNQVSQADEYTEEIVNQMRDELAKIEDKVESLALECREMESNLRKLRELKPETELSIQTIRLDIQELVAEKNEVSNTCKSLIAQKENEEASSAMISAIQQKKRDLQEALTKKEELKTHMLDSETRIIILEEKIMEAGGIELKVQNSKVDSIKQQIEIIKEKTSDDLMALKKAENDIKRHTKIIADNEAELNAVHEENQKIEHELHEKRSVKKQIDDKIAELQAIVNEKESMLEKIDEDLEEFTSKINDLKSEEIELRNQLEKVHAVSSRCVKLIDDAKEALEETAIRDTTPYLNWMKEEERAAFSSKDVHMLDETELASVNLDAVEEDIKEIETYMNEVKVDVEILKEYGRKQQELETRRSELNQSVSERDDVRNYCEDLKKKRLDEFMEGFNTISLSLKEMYQMITMGGNAELELVDSLDPFSEGILFSVMPPKKSWKNISNLSGGEKTLSSLALVFALHKYKPTPLYVMDEIDAALDFRNVSIVANYIKERTKNAQFIVISLRNNMFELAQQLVGIYKVSNRTRSISMKNDVLFSNEKAIASK